jgi:uncharacterized protein involved in outer membrane biogenesis
MRKRLIRLGLLLIVLIIASGAIMLKLSIDSMADVAQQRLSEELERPVTFTDASLSFRSGLGVGVSGLTIDAKPGEPQAAPLQVEGVHIGARLMPLLRKRLEVTGMTLTKPVLDLRVDAQGVTNFTPPAGMAAEAASDNPMPGVSSPLTVVAAANIDEGHLRYQNAQTGISAVLDRIDQTLSLQTSADPNDMAFSGETHLQGVTFQQIHVPDILAAFDFADRQFALNSLDVSIFGGHFTGNGKVDVREADRPIFAVQADISDLSVSEAAGPLAIDMTGLEVILDGTSTWAGGGSTIEDVTNSLTGEMNLKTRTFDVKLSEFMKAIPGIGMLPDLGTARFHTGTAHLLVRNQQMLVENALLESDKLSGVITGAIGFDESLDLQLRVTFSEAISNSLLGSVGGFLLRLLKDDAGRIALDIDIGGTIETPAYTLNRKRPQDAAVDQQKQKISDQLQGAKQDALDALQSGDAGQLNDQLKSRADSAGVEDLQKLGEKARGLLDMLRRKPQ